MFSLTYISTANRRYSTKELQVLGSVSAENNLRDKITGILLHKDGNFMQVLEGNETAVRNVFFKIGCDSQHRGLITLLQGEIPERKFPHWSMRVEDIMAPSLGRPSTEFAESLLADVRAAPRPTPMHALVMRFAELR